MSKTTLIILCALLPAFPGWGGERVILPDDMPTATRSLPSPAQLARTNRLELLAGPLDPLQVQPATGFVAGGAPGGPFAPTTGSLTLTSAAPGPLELQTNWALASPLVLGLSNYTVSIPSNTQRFYRVRGQVYEGIR